MVSSKTSLFSPQYPKDMIISPEVIVSQGEKFLSQKVKVVKKEENEGSGGKERGGRKVYST